MTWYEVFLFFHIVSVVLWLGAGATLALIALYAQRAGDGELLRRMAPIGRWLGPRVFGPAALGALVFGLLLVHEGSWTFHPLWIKLGLAAFAVSFLLNAGVRAPLLGHAERGEPVATQVLRLLPRFELAVLFLAVADMVVKP